MSNTHQNKTATQAEPTVASNAQRITQRDSDLGVPNGSTPVKKKHGPDLTFASQRQKFDDVRKYLGKEMDGRFLGPMPPDEFLENFLPAVEAKLPELEPDPFKSVPSDVVESAVYQPLIDTTQAWMPGFTAVNTNNREDTENGLHLKIDISVFKDHDGVPLPIKTDCSRMELWWEIKPKRRGVAFQDPEPNLEEARLLAIEQGSFAPDTVEGNDVRGQLAHYAGAMHSMQFRHFSFSILIEGDYARFLRWETGGTIVTAAFNYRTSPEFLAEFLWRFSHLSDEDRGYDISIEPANLIPEVATRVRKTLSLGDNTPLYQYTMPGLIEKGYAYGPRPPTENRSFASRCSRTLPVVWIPAGAETWYKPKTSSETDGAKKDPWSEERMVYLKDTWRFLSTDPNVLYKAEHEIYEILYEFKTPNIPEHVAGGDVEGGKTRTQDFRAAPWLCVKPTISQFQHYRLAVPTVGRVLFQFICTKQLVSVVYDAVKAHSHAFVVAKILHRDVSMGNIIIKEDGTGLLIDWEMAKEVGQGGSRRPDRTGTWQFMSASLLRNPAKMQTYKDDLESFLHVLGWTTLRYIPAIDTYIAVDRSNDMLKFDQISVCQERPDRGGDLKSQSLSAEEYPSQMFQPRKATPLYGLLRTLSMPFKSLYWAPVTVAHNRLSLYITWPPAAEDRIKIKTLNLSDRKSLQFHIAVEQYFEDMEKLESSSFFIDEMKNALEQDDWPTDDGPDVNLPLPSLAGATEKQEQIKTTQRRLTQHMLAKSKGVPTSSKRSASPTPEPSAKRRRGTPASESQSLA